MLRLQVLQTSRVEVGPSLANEKTRYDPATPVFGFEMRQRHLANVLTFTLDIGITNLAIALIENSVSLYNFCMEQFGGVGRTRH